jgi:hypothetical protein
LHDVEFHFRDALSSHSERLGGGGRNVNHATRHKGAAIIDANRHGPPGDDVSDAQFGSEWQRAMRGGELAWIELSPLAFSIRSNRSS